MYELLSISGSASKTNPGSVSVELIGPRARSFMESVIVASSGKNLERQFKSQVDYGENSLTITPAIV